MRAPGKNGSSGLDPIDGDCSSWPFVEPVSVVARADPMLHEATVAVASSLAHCYSPDGAGETPRSPLYVPVSGLWPANRGENQAEIVFGAGVQLGSTQSESSAGHVGDIAELVEKMDIDHTGERGMTVVPPGNVTPLMPAQADTADPVMPV